MAPLLKQLAGQSLLDEAFAFHMKAFGKSVRPTVGLVNEWIEKAGDRIGLARDQIFDACSLRHLFRTQAMFLGFDEEIINALMGHQSAGLEFFNPYREGFTFKDILEAGRKLASRIAKLIGFMGEG
jgi:integrase